VVKYYSIVLWQKSHVDEMRSKGLKNGRGWDQHPRPDQETVSVNDLAAPHTVEFQIAHRDEEFFPFAFAFGLPILISG